MRRLIPAVLAVAILVLPAAAQTGGPCACASDAELMAHARQCSLCREAEEHANADGYFFLKDNNPHKPNRWLILPVSHRHDGPGVLRGMTRAGRTRFWSAAIARAQELFGGDWALAVNGDKFRTQCHAHVHIGKFIRAAERGIGFVVVKGPEGIPEPKDGTGFWVHPVGGKLHVHLGEQICETVLVR